jgi:SAM-dependent methyltransferase
MSESAVDRWGRMLEEWALPDDLLAAVPDSPYGWSPELWKRRARIAAEQGEQTPTTAAVRSILAAGGTLLDVGAGTGRASLSLAAEGHPLTAVEKNPDLVAGFRERAAELGVAAQIVEGVWPEVAGSVPAADVVICAHVVYDVQDIDPFVSALSGHARGRAVVELTPDHPWSSLSPYYRVLHDLDRPTGPTYQDFLEVAEMVVGTRPEHEVWTRSGQLWFESWDEILEHYGKRLLVGRDRWPELRDLLAPDTIEEDDRLYLGSRDRTLVTVWWSAAA